MTTKENKENQISYVLTKATDNNVKFIRLWFTDIFGSVKGFGITIDELEKVLNEGASFDGASIFGSERFQESEMIAMPDPTTFEILPWRPEENSVAKITCEIINKDGTPSALDSRFILKKKLNELKEKGLNFYVAPEIEYFYLEDSENMKPIDEKTYFDQVGIHSDLGSDLRRKTVIGLEKIGIPIQKFHHEVSPGQQEISLRYNDSLTIADNIQTFKLLVKEVANSENVFATFMPKPFEEYEGNGMHLHISLFEGEKNLFAHEKKSKSGVSKQGENFTAGLLKHVNEFMLATNQWVNSYKRIASMNEAPSYRCWSKNTDYGNLITIPEIRKIGDISSRIEFRLPDPACNPYLSFAAIITAGLEGMQNNYKLEPAMEESFSTLSPEDLNEFEDTKKLAQDLGTSIKNAEKGSILKNALGEEAYSVFLKGKKREWAEYLKTVSNFELKNFLNL
ncbi:MAG: glutamine synthetase [Chloroflexi bacterium]|nr:glutamine synthetase [Chloroflexota bacterium]|tara:strand:- start:11223 stop:12578 length:1356 start_codon:yes stop_codon:yes gene_type:complete